MKIIISFLIASILVLANNSYSQDFTVPADYQLNTKEDYVKYENDIISASKWLIATPLNEQQDKRKDVSAFVVKWINGSPTVNVEINTNIMDFEKKNSGMLVLYMAASAKYVLENNYSKDMRAKHRAALRDMISVYKSGKGIQKDKKMEKLAKSDEDGKLDEWIADNLKIEGH
ncbi:MAG TPA: hypothetical protein VK483_04515 [Chitinophagaceae bacterium]|nr:hypothetical protein [Chitinophagaceae bacterium]